MRRALIGAFALVLLAGCGSDDGAPRSDDAAKPAAEPVALKVDPPSRTVTTDELTVQGAVTPGSRVTVDGREASVNGGRFRARVPLEAGSNRIEVIARRRGYLAGRDRLAVKRRAPAPVAVPTQTTPTEPPQSQPNVNPHCPPGTEPDTSGGCQPYDEQDGQVEPKISDPRCYSDRPPAGCF
jgi:hypothetical protein